MGGKGRNYRKPKAINWKKKDITVKGLDNLIKGKQLSKKVIDSESLIPSMSVILTKVEKKA